jgi:hypothetical protein
MKTTTVSATTARPIEFTLAVQAANGEPLTDGHEIVSHTFPAGTPVKVRQFSEKSYVLTIDVRNDFVKVVTDLVDMIAD